MIFKRQIEKYYARHYLKYMCIKINGGMHYDEDVGKVSLKGRFDLSHLEGRTAIFRDDEVAEQFSSWYEGAMESAMYSPPTRKAGPDYNPNVLVQIRREVTDLLPIDMQYEFRSPDFTIRFDWRTYLSTFFDEQKRIAGANPNPYKAHIPYAMQLRENIDRGEIDPLEAFKMAIERVMPSVQACSENAFVLTRRKRRLRVGMSVHGWLEEKDEDWRENYSRYGENVVAQKIKDSHFWVGCEEYSDEEDDEETTNKNAAGSEALEIWETTDESDESSSRAEISDTDSKDESTPSLATATQPTKGKKIVHPGGKTIPQQGPLKHRRQQSSFDVQIVKRTKISQP